MSRWTTLILFLLLAGVGAYIFLVERERKPPAPPGSESRVVDLRTPDVTAVRIERAGETIRLEKTGASTWAMAEPVHCTVERDAVLPMLATLASLRHDREVRPTPEDDLGLGNPRARLAVDLPQGPLTVRFGDDDPAGGGVYLRVEGEDRVHVIPRRLYDFVARPSEDYRPREVVQAQRFEIEGLTYEGPAGRRVFHKLGDLWRIVEPIEDAADAARLKGLLDYVAGLRVERFADDAPKDLAAYGLDPPRATIEIAARKRAAGGAVTHETIAFGKPAEGAEDRVYARAGGAPFVYEVGSLALREMARDIQDYRDRVALHGWKDRIARVAVGDVVLENAADPEAARTVQRPGEEEPLPDFSMKAPKEGAADGASVAALLEALVSWKTAAFLPEGAVLGPDPIPLEVKVEDDTFSYRVDRAVTEDPAGGPPTFLWSRVGDPWVFRAEGRLPALLRDAGARYRGREVRHIGLRSVASIEIAGSALDRAYRRSEDGKTWSRARGGEGAEPSTFQIHVWLMPLVDLVCARWLGPVEDDAAASLGLDAPSLAVTLGLTEDAGAVALRVGAPVEGGRAAAIDGEDWAFVIPEETVASLQTAPEAIEDVGIADIEHEKLKETSLAEIYSALEHVDPLRRRWAIQQLWLRGERSAGKDLLPLLDDPNPGVRIQAAVAARKLGVVEAVPKLIEMLFDEAYDSPQKPRPPSATPVKSYALIGIKELTGQEFGFEPERWRKWWAEHRDEVLAKAREEDDAAGS